MSQQQESAIQQPNEDIRLINALRESTRKTVIDNKLSFNVVFTTLSQLASMFAMDFCLLEDGELTDENVAVAIARFNEQTTLTAKVGLKNVQAIAKAEEEAAIPKIITEI